MEFNLIVDPKFMDKIPPLTVYEFRQLEENIVEAGEIYEPIAVWNGVIIDGHNRYKIAQLHPEVRWTTRIMEFTDEWAAADWMYKNQLGRRNLTEEQRKYMIGKMYEARKKSNGGNRRNKRNELGQFAAVPQNGELRHKKAGTAAQIANELKIGKNTVERAGKFAKGVDKANEVSPGFREDILNKRINASFSDVASISEMESEEAKQAVQEIYDSGKINMKGGSSFNREMKKAAQEIARQLANVDSPSTFTIDDLIEELKENGMCAVKTANNTIKHRMGLIVTDSEKKRVKETLFNISLQFREVADSL